MGKITIKHAGLALKHDWAGMPTRDMDGGAFRCACACCNGECDACDQEAEAQYAEEHAAYEACRDAGMSAADAQRAMFERLCGDAS